MAKKTDNSNIDAKLTLRRHFLDLYPPKSVFDCCQGDKKIWSNLLAHYPTKYLGVDLKSKKGRLKIDSKRILGQAGWDYDVIDIDTYGSPWGHWVNVLKYSSGDVTVFLTIGLVKIGGGSLSAEAMDWLGLNKFQPKISFALAASCNDMSVSYGLDRSRLHGFGIELALEAPCSKNARYIGVRLKKIL